MVSLGGTIPYFLFQIFYTPGFYFFKLFLLPPLLILIVLGLEVLRSRRGGRLPLPVVGIYWIWVLALWWVNVMGIREEWQNAHLIGPF